MTATPKTFTAHGHTWTSHTPGDPMPCDGKTQIFIIDLTDNIYRYVAFKCLEENWWSSECENPIIGWRYADEPQAKPVKTTKGAGTPEFRFTALMNALEERFPEAVDPASSDPPEPKLLAAIDSLLAKPASAWRPIEEAPRDGTRLLVIHHRTQPLIGRWNTDEWFWEDDCFGSKPLMFQPTHFMPLPESP